MPELAPNPNQATQRTDKNTLAARVDNVRQALGDDWLPDVSYVRTTDEAIEVLADHTDAVAQRAVIAAARQQLSTKQWQIPRSADSLAVRVQNVGAAPFGLCIKEYGSGRLADNGFASNLAQDVTPHNYASLYVMRGQRDPLVFDLDFTDGTVTQKDKYLEPRLGTTPVQQMHALLNMLLHTGAERNVRIMSPELLKELDVALRIIRNSDAIKSLREQQGDGNIYRTMITDGSPQIIGIKFSGITVYIETAYYQGSLLVRQTLEINTSPNNRVAMGRFVAGAKERFIQGNEVGELALNLTAYLDSSIRNHVAVPFDPQLSKLEFKPLGHFVAAQNKVE